MSGRRRRDDGWDDGHQDAQDDRRDSWADDSSVGDWGGDQDLDYGKGADRSGSTAGKKGGGHGNNGAAGAYVRNAPQNGNAYAAPSFPSFQTKDGGGNGRRQADGYDDRRGGSAHGGQRGAPNGYGDDGYGDTAYGDASYGDPAYRDTVNSDAGYGAANYGDTGYDAGRGANGDGYARNGQGGGRRDSGRYDAGYDGADGGGYGKSGYGSGQENDSGYGGGFAGSNGREAGPGHAPEFTPIDSGEIDDDSSPGTPRPYGRLSIYTLHEDKTREFDRLAERAAEGVRASEPDTLVYVIHIVPKAPMQRIIYEIYRDRGAFQSHERQPHIRQFAADRVSCVLATNIIDLRLKYAKVAALGPSPEAPARQQASWTPRPQEAGAGGDRYQAAAASQPSGQYPSSQYADTQYRPAPQPHPGTVASFTPAKDRYPADNGQFPATGREQYAPAPQYEIIGNGTYGSGNGQYGTANGYSGADGYANGGSYSNSAYPSSNGYSGGNGNGYQGANGYSDSSGYSGSNGYSGGNGYSGANGYSNTSGYPNGSGGGYSGAGATGYPNGYQNGSSGYPDGGGYSNGSGYGAANGYADNAGGPGQTAQYAPRYRELTSGSPDAGAGGYPGDDRYGDGGRQSAKQPPSDWPPRSSDHR
jgi:quinol monooxygenase YgiN